MKDAAAARAWALLARVRQLRVERARRLLSEAQAGLRRAADDTARRRDALAAHHAARGDIVRACAFGARGAGLWRAALQRHDAGRPALDAALGAARDAQARAHERLAAARQQLHRAMRRQDDARERVRGFAAARREDSDPDD